MSDDAIERLRAHVEKHKHREQAFFSTAGLRELLDLLDTQARQFREFVERDADDAIELRRQRDELNFQIEHLEACVTIHDRNRKELKAQVERLLAKEGERIAKELRRIEKYEGTPTNTTETENEL